MIILVSAFIAGLLLRTAAGGRDTQAKADATRTAVSALSVMKRHMGEYLKEYAQWDEVMENSPSRTIRSGQRAAG